VDRRAADRERGEAEQAADGLETRARVVERHAETIDPEGNPR
jgi:hypothetical protein